MAYVRKRGKQLLIVHGRRRTATGKVEQDILFTLYSQAEAREAVSEKRRWMFRNLLESCHPNIRFDWKKIDAGLRENLAILPEEYAHRENSLHDHFRRDLLALTRQLLLNDPQHLHVSATLVKAHRYDLEYLKEIIDWRIRTCEQVESEWNQDSPFLWRHQIQGYEVPPDAVETVCRLYYEGNFDRAKAVCRLLTETFSGFSEGHLYLGLIAARSNDFDSAIQHATEAARIARSSIPAKWRPEEESMESGVRQYRSALTNLGLVLARAKRFTDALAVGDQIVKECNDDMAAATVRSVTYLNDGQFALAMKTALHVNQIWPTYSFIAALSAYEQGLGERALGWWIHGTLNHPVGVRALLGYRVARPESKMEDNDLERAHELRADIQPYLDRAGQRAIRAFRKTLNAAPVAAMRDELQHVRNRWASPNRSRGWKNAFDRMQEMQSVDYAAREASELRGRLASFGLPKA